MALCLEGILVYVVPFVLSKIQSGWCRLVSIEWVSNIVCLGCFLGIAVHASFYIWGPILARTCTIGTGVGLKHPVIRWHVSFRATSNLFAWHDLFHMDHTSVGYVPSCCSIYT